MSPMVTSDSKVPLAYIAVSNGLDLVHAIRGDETRKGIEPCEAEEFTSAVASHASRWVEQVKGRRYQSYDTVK
jgi:hypothetical protein